MQGQLHQPHNLPDTSGLAGGWQGTQFADAGERRIKRPSWQCLWEMCQFLAQRLGEVNTGGLIGWVHEETAYLKGAAMLKPG